jgi:nicotinate-nucleotide pyrophosphorylase (carboxylating)
MDPNLLDELSHCVQHALKEDDVHNDISSLSCIPHMESIEAKIYLKQRAHVSGLVLLSHIFQQIDPTMRVQLNAQEGEEYEEGTILAQIIGNPLKILSVERVILNFLSHLSGITTQTAKFVEAVKGYPCDILDTRKTLPGLRYLQKYAVRIGGGKNHRLNLSDKIFIRDNHISILRYKSRISLLESILQVRSRFPNSHLEIEVSNIDFFDEALAVHPNSILLSNLEIEDVREAVVRSRNAKNTYLEVSGNISLENVVHYAKTGVDGIAIGALTQSVKAVDMSLKI